MLTTTPFPTRRFSYSRPMVVLLAAIWCLAGVAVAAQNRNPPAQGFDLSGSDPRAIVIADNVMDAMGGREAWDQTRYLSWNFFGRRTHLWDKWTGDLRFEQGGLLVLMNVNTKQGRAFKDGVELTGEEQTKALTRGYEAWVNDSYWLLMPYKLKDSGVTLTLVGEQAMEDGRAADVLQLTFEGVGVTPENKYHVFVAKDTGLVEQWAFFRSATDEKPGFTTPWAKWTKLGSILLSGDRGRMQLSDIKVYQQVDPAAFQELDEPNRESWH